MSEEPFVLTSVIGLLGVGVGLVLMIYVAETLGSALGIDLNAPIGTVANGYVWLALFVVAIPITIYAGVVVVAGFFASAMILLGNFTVSEALRYALLSRYPQRWLKS